MKLLVEAIHQGALGEVKHLIHIGIGGSALGPALAIDALAREQALVDVHVVSNIDGCALEEAFAACDPATTMIAVASKTFTTIETMTNAHKRAGWLEENGVEDPYGRVVALTGLSGEGGRMGRRRNARPAFRREGRRALFALVVDRLSCRAGAGLGRFRGLPGRRGGDRSSISAIRTARTTCRCARPSPISIYTRIRGCQTRACFAYDERLRAAARLSPAA